MSFRTGFKGEDIPAGKSDFFERFLFFSPVPPKLHPDVQISTAAVSAATIFFFFNFCPRFLHKILSVSFSS